MKYWLVKTEPNVFSINDLEKALSTSWEGVRNYQARNNLIKMRIGDLVLIYHSNSSPAVVGLAKVTEEHYPDHTSHGGKFFAVNIEFVKKFSKPYSLAMIKTNNKLQNLMLIKQPRLSVMPIDLDEWLEILAWTK